MLRKEKVTMDDFPPNYIPPMVQIEVSNEGTREKDRIRVAKVMIWLNLCLMILFVTAT